MCTHIHHHHGAHHTHRGGSHSHHHRGGHSSHHHRAGHHGHHKGTHHKHHKGSHKSHHHHAGKGHHRGTGARGGGAIHHGGFASGGAGAGVIPTPSAQDQLVKQVASALFTGGFIAEIVQAIEAVIGSQTDQAPGRLLPGTISTNAGAIQLTNGTEPSQAMVYLHGSTYAVPVVIPTHLHADVAPGQEVWVMAANGRRDDLIMLAIRNYLSTPPSNAPPASKVQPGTFPDGLYAFGVQGVNGQTTDQFQLNRRTNQPRSIVMGVGLGVGGTGGSFYIWDSTANRFIFAVDPNGIITTGILPAASVAAGQLSVTDTSLLVTGHQAVGQVGFRSRCETTGGIFGTYQNYKVRCQNTPSGVTITVSSSALQTSQAVSGITNEGFIFEMTSSGIGGCFWYGSYATTGNCILAIDEAARTYDHHCDHRDPITGEECGHIRRGLSLDTDIDLPKGVDEGPGFYAMCTPPCPVCGGREYFKTDCTSGDEALRTLAPEGQANLLAAQPYLIRRVQALRNLPMLP